MPSSNEIYERGALDAEHDDLNPFYYQHYYHYRRGYDEARRQMRSGPLVVRRAQATPLLIGLALAVAALLGAWFVLRASGEQTAAVAPTSPAIGVLPTRATLPTVRPTLEPTAAPSPVPALRVGGQARVVNVGASPLRARAEPGLSRQVRARFPADSQLAVLEGPTQADGLVWWRLAGTAGEGWSVERSPEGVLFLEPLP